MARTAHAPGAPTDAALDALTGFVERHPRLCVLTGAGLSTASGIPAYRDRLGEWKRPAPVHHKELLGCLRSRQRYWARSLAGWRRVEQARPNPAHEALAGLERAGRIGVLITQNIDRLHQRAGSRRVIDLHGRLDRVVCLGCGALSSRSALQLRLEAENPAFAHGSAGAAPDGDAESGDMDYSGFRVPDCERCGGLLKPDVVFFGDCVPPARAQAAVEGMLACDGLLVAGSSLMVYSGFRFCRRAQEEGLPMAAINLGRTRADSMLDLKLELDCTAALRHLARAFGSEPGQSA